MLHNNMDLSRFMVHVQQVENNRKKRGNHDTRRTKPHDQAGPSNGGKRNNFGVHEQPKIKKGQQSSGNSNFQRSTTPRGCRPEPKKDKGDDTQHPRKNYAKCGRVHNGQSTQCTNASFVCGNIGHMVKDIPLNRGQAGGNAQPRLNLQGAVAAEPSQRNPFNTLKGREKHEKSVDLVTGILQVFSTFLYYYMIQGLHFPL